MTWSNEVNQVLDGYSGPIVDLDRRLVAAALAEPGSVDRLLQYGFGLNWLTDSGARHAWRSVCLTHEWTGHWPVLASYNESHPGEEVLLTPPDRFAVYLSAALDRKDHQLEEDQAEAERHLARALNENGAGIERIRSEIARIQWERELLGWSLPERQTEAVLPVLPLDAFPPVLRDLIEGVSSSVQAAPEIAAMLALTTAGAMAAKRAVIQGLLPTHHEPLNLYGVAVAEPSERKSPVFKAVLAPVEALERQLRSEAAPAIQEAEALKKLAGEHVATALKAAKQGGGEPDAQAAYLQAVDAEAAVHVPAHPRLVADDATPEALIQLLAEHGGRIFVASSEGGTFANWAGRYNRGQANLDGVLKGWSGDRITVDRKTGDHFDIESPAVSVALTVRVCPTFS